jgi:hypothetical protein
LAKGVQIPQARQDSNLLSKARVLFWKPTEVPCGTPGLTSRGMKPQGWSNGRPPGVPHGTLGGVKTSCSPNGPADSGRFPRICGAKNLRNQSETDPKVRRTSDRSFQYGLQADTSWSATWHSGRCQILGCLRLTARLASWSATGPGGFMVALREVYEDGQPRVAFTGERSFTANDKRRRVPASTPPPRPDLEVKCPSLEADSWVADHCLISQVV